MKLDHFAVAFDEAAGAVAFRTLEQSAASSMQRSTTLESERQKWDKHEARASTNMCTYNTYTYIST
jgi:hypothetical protein